MAKTVAVAGVNGYAASTLLPLLESDETVTKVVGIDSTPWKGGFNKVTFFREDIRKAGIADIINGVDIFCYLAASEDEMQDQRISHDSYIVAVKNVLTACAKCRVKKIIFLSTTSVYAFHDVPGRFYTEDLSVSVNKSGNTFQTAAAKIEKTAMDFITEHPEITLTIIRSSTLMGPNIDNALEKSLSMKTGVFPSGMNSIQFIHESDLGSSLYLSIKKDIPGIFNAAADEMVDIKWCFQKTGVRLISFPVALARKIADAGFRLGIYPFNADRLDLLSQSVCADNKKLKHTAGWSPAYSSAAAFMTYADKLEERRSKDNGLQSILSWVIKSGKRLKPFLPVLATFRLAKIPGIRRLVPWLNPQKNSINYLPVNERINVRGDILPSQVVHDLIESADIHVVMDKCGCRMLRNCNHYTHEVGCLFMGETALKLPHGVCRPVSKSQAHAHADRAISLGLLPMTGKVRIDNFIYMTPDQSKLLSMCFCCDCCCILTSYKHVPAAYLDGIIQPINGLTIEVMDNCTGCGTCLKTCAFNAIGIIDGRAVHNSQCRGCGRCERFCPSNAVSIAIRNEHYNDQVKERVRRYVEF